MNIRPSEGGCPFVPYREGLVTGETVVCSLYMGTADLDPARPRGEVLFS